MTKLAAPTLGFTMIVKNGAATLRNCLQSVPALASEMVVADTGSTDDSVAIARECGATVISVPWQGDFASARNAALERCTTDWVLSLDADEELDWESEKVISRLLEKARPRIGGYIVTIRNYIALRHGNVNGNRAKPNDGRSRIHKDAPAYAEHRTVRLFRRHPAIQYKGCVHEAVAPQIVGAGMQLANAGFDIHHFGFLAGSETYSSKAQLYLALGQSKVEQDPANALAWVELARQLYEPFRKNEEALLCVQRALAIQPNMTAAWFIAGMVNLELGRQQAAVDAFGRCADDPEHAAEREHHLGDALHDLGRLKESQAAYGRSLRVTGHDPQVESKLGYVEVRLGDCEAGFAKMQQAIDELPNGAELHERLIKAFVAAGRMAEAAGAAETFAARVLHPKTILRAAAIRAHLKQEEQARRLIQRGLQAFPESPELKSAEAQLAAAAGR